MSKFVIVSLLAVLAVANARGIVGDLSDIENNDIAPLQKEGRFLDLLEIPTISGVIYTSLRVLWFLLSTVCSVVDDKLAALALAVNIGIWLLRHKFPVILGAVLMLGFCKVTGLCTFKNIFAADESDELDYAVEYLDMGSRKYAKSF